MKTQKSIQCRPTFSRGFSLLEMLIVITIIAVLASVGYPVATKMIKSGKVEKNREITRQLEVAINRFYEEYKYLPITVTDDKELTPSDIEKMLIELEGQEDTPALNVKGINYIENIATGANGRGGILRDSTPQQKITGFQSTLGTDFRIFIDGNYDQKLTPPSGFANDNTEVRGKRVLIFTADDPANYDDGISDPAYEDTAATNWR